MDYLINEIPFFQVPNEIFECDLNVNEKIVFMYLCRCGNNGKQAFPSQQTIADKCSISKSTAKRAVNVLVDNSYIIKERRFTEGKNKSNIYKVNYNRVTQNLPRVTENPCRVTVNHYKELSKNKDLTRTIILHHSDEVTCALLNTLNAFSIEKFNKTIRQHDPNKHYVWDVLDGYDEELTLELESNITKYEQCNLDYLETIQARFK